LPGYNARVDERKVVQTGGAPRAIGPYSQAIVAQGFVFCSGMIALDPASGEMVGASDVEAQARRALDSLKALLEASGSSLERVVKTTVYLTDMGDFAAVNAVYGSYFTAAPPARATVQVAGLPRGAMVEIDAVALVSPSA
jgi:2-iminobutanoate/2-iminopropanoate deaminase